MNQNYICIGIDLGTTNSEIVINRNGNIEIIKNIFGDEYTPSVFGIDKSKNKVVGKRAYERLYKDASLEESKNYKAEIKRLMGTPEKVFFERTNEYFTPEEISAEILKSLKEDVLRKYPDFDVSSAVITVPAYFSVLQSEATKKAGNLAGFKNVVLLQEPIAAAISYGFMNTKDENWLVYDLGGGTFDVAVISSKDGILSVLSHGGDNFLGGKDFDWILVDKVIAPKILEKFKLSDFNRGNTKYFSVFSKLKYFAENAKIYLSQYDKTFVEVDMIGKDEDGKDIYLSIEITRLEFENLIKDYIDKTIELSKEVIKDSGLDKNMINRVILVGGSTMIPYIRKRIENDLNIKVDSSVDPFTVVARGACIYGMSQYINNNTDVNKDNIPQNAFYIDLNYIPLTSLNEQIVTGKINNLKEDNKNYYVIISNLENDFISEKCIVKESTFACNVKIKPNQVNNYIIKMFDNDGNEVNIYPNTFSITNGITVSNAPIPHSIGIVISKKDPTNDLKITQYFEKIFEKGSILPLKSTQKFKTVRELKRSDKNNPLWIMIQEGESEIPDRNIFVCELGIKGNDLPYDLPEGSDIEITIDINESRELFVTAYIPDIDLTLNARSTYKDEILDTNILKKELSETVKRFEDIREICDKNEIEKINSYINDISNSLISAENDNDEKRKANKLLKDLKSLLDKIEQEKIMTKLTKDFYKNLELLKEIIDNYSNKNEYDKDMIRYNDLKMEGESAISDNNKDLLKKVNDKILNFASKIYYDTPVAWADYFNDLVEKNNHILRNNQEAVYYIERGRKAILVNDIDEIKRSIKGILNFLPEKESKDDLENNVKISGITK